MTWTTFGLWLFIAYLVWYGLNVVFDLITARRYGSVTAAADTELFFEDASPPELIEFMEDAPVNILPRVAVDAGGGRGGAVLSSGEIQSTGGISIAELLIMAKDELVEHTRAIAY